MSIHTIEDMYLKWSVFVREELKEFVGDEEIIMKDHISKMLKRFMTDKHFELVFQRGLEQNISSGIKLNKSGELLYKKPRENKPIENLKPYDFFLKILSYNWSKFSEEEKKRFNKLSEDKNGKETCGYFNYIALHNWKDMNEEEKLYYKTKFFTLDEDTQYSLLHK